jgi:CRP-like cAMP-binding protein
VQMAEFKNHVLSTLTRDEIALLSPLRSIELHVGDYLLHAGDRVEQAVFPESGVISLITDIGGGSAIEIAMIGREGLLGSSVVAGNGRATTDLLVQVSGNGYTVPRSRFLHALAQSSRLSRQMSLVDASLFAQAQQSAACNAAHSAQARICRWLLELHDRSDTEVVPLTQSFLARMVGVQRTTVTLVASKLQSAGIIRCRRGKVRVLDPAKLERWRARATPACGRRAKAWNAAPNPTRHLTVTSAGSLQRRLRASMCCRAERQLPPPPEQVEARLVLPPVKPRGRRGSGRIGAWTCSERECATPRIPRAVAPEPRLPSSASPAAAARWPPALRTRT